MANTGDYPIEPNEQGYYIVKPGDGGSLLNTLDVVNALPASEGRAYIFLSDGTYDLGREVLTPISRSNISIIGQSMDNTIVINEAPQEEPLEEQVEIAPTMSLKEAKKLAKAQKSKGQKSNSLADLAKLFGGNNGK